MSYEEWKNSVLNAESVKQKTCVVCGRPATNNHHVIPKGIGGVGKKAKESPTLTLCGMGNIDGCHGLAHKHQLHFRFTDAWEFLLTAPMKTIDALDLTGWRKIKEE